jgi:hypothetical protein
MFPIIRTIIVTLFLFNTLSISSCGSKEKLDCTQWHTGTYQLMYEGREIRIERDDFRQIESDVESGSYTVFAIKWLDDCTYRLFFSEGEERYAEIWKGEFMEVIILDPTDEGYSYKASFSGTDRSEIYEIKKIN